RSHFVLMRRIDVGWARMANNLLPLVGAIVLAGLAAATVLVVIAVRALHRRDAHNADKNRAAKYHRFGVAGDLAAKRARQQTAEPVRRTTRALGLWAGAPGFNWAGWSAVGFLRIPVPAREQMAARLRSIPARPAPADDRCQVPARGRHRLARSQERGRAQAGCL